MLDFTSAKFPTCVERERARTDDTETSVELIYRKQGIEVWPLKLADISLSHLLEYFITYLFIGQQHLFHEQCQSIVSVVVKLTEVQSIIILFVCERIHKELFYIFNVYFSPVYPNF